MAVKETIELDTTEAKAKLDELEAQVDRILSKLAEATPTINIYNEPPTE